MIHSGDLTYRGDIKEIATELNKLSKLQHEHIVLINGNHDWLGERNPSLMRQMCEDKGIIYLQHESVQIEGLNIFGSAFTPEFCSWAFNVPRGQALKDKWDLIPDNTDILVTHGGPYSILDACPDGRKVGCEELYKRVMELKSLKLHVFGHIHHSRGMIKINETTFINASNCDERYKTTNKPFVISINSDIVNKEEINNGLENS